MGLGFPGAALLDIEGGDGSYGSKSSGARRIDRWGRSLTSLSPFSVEEDDDDRG